MRHMDFIFFYSSKLFLSLGSEFSWRFWILSSDFMWCWVLCMRFPLKLYMYMYIYMYPNSLSHGFIIDRIDVIKSKPSLATPNHISKIRTWLTAAVSVFFWLVQIVFLRFQLCSSNAGLMMRSLQLVISWKLVFHANKTLSSWPTYCLRQWSAQCSISWRFTLTHYKLFLLKGCPMWWVSTCDALLHQVLPSHAATTSLPGDICSWHGRRHRNSVPRGDCESCPQQRGVGAEPSQVPKREEDNGKKS